MQIHFIHLQNKHKERCLLGNGLGTLGLGLDHLDIPEGIPDLGRDPIPQEGVKLVTAAVDDHTAGPQCLGEGDM